MITVLGVTGFIGSHILRSLQEQGIEYYAPERNEILPERNLGDIIYCIGLTADFRHRPFDTVEAHVSKLSQILEHCLFNSLTYLSSARVYINSKEQEVNEASLITIDPMDADELYTLTKLTGERICLSSKKKVKIIRLSNVYGDDKDSENFLTDVIRSIREKNAVSFNVMPDSSKDYISIGDAVSLIIKIAQQGKSQVYNVASGFNTSNETIIRELRKYFTFTVDLSQAKKTIIFPVINNEKIRREFNYAPGNITNFIPHLTDNKSNVPD